jgi:hypothetical protein
METFETCIAWKKISSAISISPQILVLEKIVEELKDVLAKEIVLKRLQKNILYQTIASWLL